MSALSKTIAVYLLPFTIYHTITMNRLPYSLDERTVSFSKSVLKFCNSIQITPVSRSMIEQLTKSATSIGANYAEANNASSKTDFRNKIYIAKKEAAETKYWLELFADISEDKETCRTLWQECHYILMTLQKIVNSLKGKSKTENGKRMVNSKR